MSQYRWNQCRGLKQQHFGFIILCPIILSDLMSVAAYLSRWASWRLVVSPPIIPPNDTLSQAQQEWIA